MRHIYKRFVISSGSFFAYHMANSDAGRITVVTRSRSSIIRDSTFSFGSQTAGTGDRRRIFTNRIISHRFVGQNPRFTGFEGRSEHGISRWFQACTGAHFVREGVLSARQPFLCR